MFDYEVPVYTADPAWCEITYSYTISNLSADKALGFDPTTRIFSFEQLDDLLLSGPTEKDYTITVKGETGNVVKKSIEATFTLTLKNPCIDPSYVTIQSVPYPTQESYILHDYDLAGKYQFTHEPFVV